MKKYKDPKYHTIDSQFIPEAMLKTRKWEKREYREITEDAFLNKGYKILFIHREKNLSNVQKLRLRQILRDYDPNHYFKEAWIYKELFCIALDELDYETICEVQEWCLDSEHYRIKDFWKTLKKRHKQLKNFCEHSTKDFKFTNAYTESINNQCKVAKRVSHGFVYKSSYKRKLSSRFLNQ